MCQTGPVGTSELDSQPYYLHSYVLLGKLLMVHGLNFLVVIMMSASQGFCDH